MVNPSNGRILFLPCQPLGMVLPFLPIPSRPKKLLPLLCVEGLGDDRRVFNVVEVFSYPASQWYVAEPLPTPLWGITSTTVGTTTYLVGGVDSIIYGTSHCFSVSVDSIIKQATTSKVSQFQHGSEWTPITNPPLISSCAASMDNIVMAIGGWDSSTRSSTAIYFLNERGSWERIWGGGLPRPLGKIYCCVLTFWWAYDCWRHRQ